MNLVDQFRKLIAPLHRRVMLMVGRGIVESVKDSGKIQRLQLSLFADEIIDGIDRVQEYGFTSRPKPGAQAVVVFLGGNRDQGVVIGVDDGRARPTDMAEGDTGLYTASGARVTLEEATQNVIIKLGKLKITNSADKELITVLESLVQAIIDARTMTLLGPQPLLNTSPTFPSIKTEVTGFKVV